VIKFVSDWWQVRGFLRFPPTIKLTPHDITEIVLKVALNTITPNPEIKNISKYIPPLPPPPPPLPPRPPLARDKILNNL
jgi:hypothetical protein